MSRKTLSKKPANVKQRLYRAKNRKKVNAVFQAYRDKNRKRLRIYQRKYQKAWNKKNRSYVTAKRRKRYAKHKIEIRLKFLQWEQKNKVKRLEDCRATNQRRRARKNKARGSFTADQFRKLCKKFHHICLRCFKKRKLTPDHIRPLSKGGSNSIRNIQPLCQPCNASKGAKYKDYRKGVVTTWGNTRT